MKASTRQAGVTMNRFEEITAFRDALDYLANPEERYRVEADKKREELRQKGIAIAGGDSLAVVPPGERGYAKVARAIKDMGLLDAHDEILAAIGEGEEFDAEAVGRMEPVLELTDADTGLVRFVFGAYAGITKDERGRTEAEDLIREMDEKLTESRALVEANPG